ncbi:MAG: hypothetical protein N4A63_02280 [Vallitalea sp.]|jgi:hypothetical protein|nr:hypothetical protein [Vallitalea sp.]
MKSGENMLLKTNKQIFEIDKMLTHRKDNDNKHVITCEKETSVKLEEVFFNNNLVSSIEIYKLDFKDNSEPSIFVNLYMGNIEICTMIYKTGVVIEIDSTTDNYGNDYIRTYRIREIWSYDK